MFKYGDVESIQAEEHMERLRRNADRYKRTMVGGPGAIVGQRVARLLSRLHANRHHR